MEANSIFSMSKTLSLKEGKIIRIEPGAFLVETDSGPCRAVPALGCLIHPESGDTVLLARGGTSYILSVLERGSDSGEPSRLVFENGVHIHSQAGPIELSSHDDIRLASDKRIAVMADELSLAAGKGEASFESFTFFSRFVRAHMEKLGLVAEFIDSFIHRLSQKLTWSHRWIEELEEIQAGNTRTVVKETMTVHTGNTIMTAEENVKIDAEQIHLG